MIQTPNTFRRGFTFAEILFAVMILGIGFIMIAGVFPVALQQAQLTRADAASASVSEAATRWLINNNNVLHAEDFPTPSGDFFGPPQFTSVHPPDNLSTWEHLRGNLIVKSDPRYAWIPVVFREQNASQAVLFVFVCESQLDASFIAADVTATASNMGTLYPRTVTVIKLVKASPTSGQLADRITFQQNGPSLSMLVPGAFVVVKRTDRSLPSVYRLGNPVSPADPTLWELTPGYDLAGDPTINNTSGLTGNLTAYVLGRRNINNLDANSFTGPAQDIGLYQTTVHLTSETARE